MTADEAYKLHATMRQHGIPGRVTPADPEILDGAWLVVDEDGCDVTNSVYAQVLEARHRQPRRGFVVAR